MIPTEGVLVRFVEDLQITSLTGDFRELARSSPAAVARGEHGPLHDC